MLKTILTSLNVYPSCFEMTQYPTTNIMKIVLSTIPQPIPYNQEGSSLEIPSNGKVIIAHANIAVKNIGMIHHSMSQILERI